jgi:DNA-binding CsgD family transcriptional regulator
MTLYKSPYLTIDYEEANSLFVMFWNTSPDDISVFKGEMLIYTDFYKKHKPKYALWLQHNFSLITDTKTSQWIETHVNEPCIKAGNQKCAFVVSKDVMAHISVIEVFDNRQSSVKPRHFASEHDARQWLFSIDSETLCNNTTTEVTFEGIDTDGNMIIKIPATNIKATFKALNKHLKHDSFINEHEQKFALLTKREKQVLSFIANGKTHTEISNDLYISSHTVSTHWRNIKKKLAIKKSTEAFVFYYNFQQ